jgi:hypothetical protein
MGMVTAAVFVATSVAVAQVGGSPTGNLSYDLMVQLVSALGPMGFVMWLVWRTTNHTIPRLAKNFEEALDRERADFKSIITDQREDFRRELDREREIYFRQIGMLEKAVERFSRE